VKNKSDVLNYYNMPVKTKKRKSVSVLKERKPKSSKKSFSKAESGLSKIKAKSSKAKKSIIKTIKKNPKKTAAIAAGIVAASAAAYAILKRRKSKKKKGIFSKK
jgi:tRNA(Ile2) C34 agmatinyltransferase TiaS